VPRPSGLAGCTASRRPAMARRGAASVVIYGHAGNRKSQNINTLLIDDRHRHLWRRHHSLARSSKRFDVMAGLTANPRNGHPASQGTDVPRRSGIGDALLMVAARWERCERAVTYGDANSGNKQNINTMPIDDRRRHVWPRLRSNAQFRRQSRLLARSSWLMRTFRVFSRFLPRSLLRHSIGS
jgi:hypothetical protein